MKKVIITAALILAAAMILSSCAFNVIGTTMYDVYANADKYEIGSIEYDAEKIKNVDIDWVSGEVLIVPSKSDKLSVTENDDGLEEDMKMRTYIDGDTLKIKFCKSGFSTSSIKNHEKKVNVEIPENVSLDVSSVSGAIRLGKDTDNIHDKNDYFNIADMNLKTVSGNITVSSLLFNIKCDKVVISTVSGDVDTRSIHCSRIESGSSAVSSIKVDSVSGNVKLSGVFEKNEVSTVSGNVSFGGFIGTLEFHTVSGKLKSDIPHTEDGKKYIFGNGSQTAKVSTVSGNLIIGE